MTTPIGVNWQDVWDDTWQDVWALTTVDDCSSGSYVDAGYWAPAGYASCDLDDCASPYVRTGYWVYGYATCDRQLPSGMVAGGKRKRKRLTVEIDGEAFSVESVEEAQALLDLARKEAAAKAQEALDRAALALNRPTRKVLADASKSLLAPSIGGSPEVQEAAQTTLREIQSLYASTLRDIEIAARLRQIQRDQEDEEDLLLLLI